jgi:membrane protein
MMLYWPLVTLLTVGGLTSLYHVSTPRRSPWLRDAPGALVTLVLWLLASYVVRGTIAASLGGGTSIYGPLSAPIVLLIWLYTLAIAVLIGAAANAAIRELYPHEEHRSLQQRFVDWVAERRRRRTEHREHPAAWDDPFDGYGPADTDDLGLAGLREAARGPLTPMSGAGRSSSAAPPPEAAAPPVEAGSRADADR